MCWIMFGSRSLVEKLRKQVNWRARLNASIVIKIINNY